MDLSKARDELEQFVIDANIQRVDLERVKNFAPRLRAENDEDLLTEFIRTNKPNDVLFYCFYEYDLQNMAVDQLKIEKEKNLRGSELIQAILEWHGYPSQVVPIGLYQTREELIPILNKAKESHLQSSDSLDGLGSSIGKKVEKLIYVLFRFYLGILRRRVQNNEKIEELCTRYKKGRQNTGDYIGFKREPGKNKCGYLTELMYITKNDEKLKDYCKKHFQCDQILTPSQIAEIGMFVTYRNLFTHDPQERWSTHKKNGDGNLSKMDRNAHEYWENNWNGIVKSMNTQVSLSDHLKHEMLKKMAVFCEQFLEVLSEKQIYPKVIVMTSVTIDEYNNRTITAESSNPNDETLFLTDCEFAPHTLFYYRPPHKPCWH